MKGVAVWVLLCGASLAVVLAPSSMASPKGGQKGGKISLHEARAHVKKLDELDSNFVDAFAQLEKDEARCREAGETLDPTKDYALRKAIEEEEQGRIEEAREWKAQIPWLNNVKARAANYPTRDKRRLRRAASELILMVHYAMAALKQAAEIESQNAHYQCGGDEFIANEALENANQVEPLATAGSKLLADVVQGRDDEGGR